MKNNNQLAQILLFVLLISAVVLALLSWRYVTSLRKLQRLQPQIMQVNAFNNIFQALKNDTVEYAKTHPDLAALLQPQEKAHPADVMKPAGK
jgi:hypothetical protein